MRLRDLDQQFHHDETQPGLPANDDVSTFSRRTMLRRSALGVTGIGVAAVLAACNDDDDEVEDPANVPDVEDPAEDETTGGDQDVDEDPIDEEAPAGGADMEDEED